MKRLFVLPILLFSGCNSAPTSVTNQQTKLALTPVPTPAVLAKVSIKSTDKEQEDWEARLIQTRDLKVVDKALQDVKLWRSKSKVVEDALAVEKDPKNRDRNKRQQQQLANAFDSLEQAVLIKRSQIETKDFKDSTGEVGKRLKQAHQFQANASKISMENVNSDCCSVPKKSKD